MLKSINLAFNKSVWFKMKKVLFIVLFSICLVLPCQKKDPSFVVTVPHGVPFVDDGYESDVDESLICSERIYCAEELEEVKGQFLYYVDHQYRGALFPDDVTLDDSVAPSEDSKICEFIHTLETTAYSDDVSKAYIKKHVRLILLLNRCWSLSSRKNAALLEELKRVAHEEALITTTAYGRYWYPCWKHRDVTSAEARRGLLKEDLLNYYHQLKKKDPTLAQKFREQNEKVFTRQVPFRRLREDLKDHPLTEEAVSELKKINKDAPLYLTIADSDTISFNACFSSYRKRVRDCDLPLDLLCASYHFNTGIAPVQFASVLDMVVRSRTAKSFPRGVYYPEPAAMSVLIPDGKKNLEESFEEYSEKKGVVKRDYETPNESVNLIRNLLLLRGADFSTFFSRSNPVLIEVPERALRKKVTRSGKVPPEWSFSAEWDEVSHKFKNWTLRDLLQMTDVSQSHARSRDWAINLLNAFDLKKEEDCAGSFVLKVNGSTYEIKNRIGSETRNMAISLLSRLFSSYSPIELAYKKHVDLKNILKNYELYKRSKQLVKTDPSKRSKDWWIALDNLKTKKELLVVLRQLFKGDVDVEEIGRCAQAVGVDMVEVLRGYLEL